MSSSPSVPTRIKYAIENGLFPDSVAKSATQIVERLEQPLRVVLLGLPQSGKSMVLNLLAGQVLIPDGLRLPTTQVEAGTEPKMTCVLPDGSQKIISGTDLGSVEHLKPVFVTATVNLPALSQVSLLEIVAGDSASDQRKAIAWGCKRADIAIWCSSEFGTDEQYLWADVPDHLKDHGFLVLTKADLSDTMAKPDPRVAQLSKSWSDDFLGILSLSAKAALKAYKPTGELDRSAFKASGASGLITAIKSQVENGHRAAMDHGELILAKYCADTDFETLVQASGVQASEVQASEPPPAPIKEPETPEPPKAPAQEEAPAPKKEPVEKPVEPVGVLPESDRNALDASLVMLADRARDLAELFDGENKVSVDEIVLHCDETVMELSEMLASVSDPELARIGALAFEVQDIITLMKLERGEVRADDAITMLLQIRRELEETAVNI